MKTCVNCSKNSLQAINGFVTDSLFGVEYNYIDIYNECQQCGHQERDDLEQQYSKSNREIGEMSAIRIIMNDPVPPFRHGQRVVSAACRNRVGQIICAPRHWDATMHDIAQASANPETWYEDDGWDEQGFVDQWGTYLTREEARIVAKFNDQIVRRCGGDDLCLYSENLY